MGRESYNNSSERSPLQEASSTLSRALDEEIKIAKSIKEIMDAASSDADTSEALRKIQEGNYKALLQQAMQKSKAAFEAWHTAFHSSFS